MDKNQYLSASVANFKELAGSTIEGIQADLIVQGQGTVIVHSSENKKPTELIFEFNYEDKGIKLIVSEGSTILKLNDTKSKCYKEKEVPIGIDPDPLCQYWLSIDDHNYVLRYGKGEMRPETIVLEYGLEENESYFRPDMEDENSWLYYVKSVDIKSSGVSMKSSVWERPITVSPPLQVIQTNKLTMNDVAANEKTVIENLPQACQQLFANVSGEDFTLNTPDFPEFEDAINYSINNPEGWCYKKLEEKADEFGEHNPDETYLRITMGVNQGNSPGIPYVMEIWPYQHYSPIHNHANANAIIRVLAGEINVYLFSMLSKYHQDPFARATFEKDQITWLTPDINQIHQLKNESPSKRACVTIQCYQYGVKNTEHYEYFDFIGEDGAIDQFVPNSDMGFLKFKETMKKEWKNKNIKIY